MTCAALEMSYMACIGGLVDASEAVYSPVDGALALVLDTKNLRLPCLATPPLTHTRTTPSTTIILPPPLPLPLPLLDLDLPYHILSIEHYLLEERITLDMSLAIPSL